MDEFEGPIEYDLIGLGLRLRDLGTERLSWRDLRVILLHSPRTSAYMRARMCESALWGVSEHLLASAVDALRWLVWSKTKDGEKNRNRPKPVPRPGVKPDKGRMSDAVAMPVDELKKYLALPRGE